MTQFSLETSKTQEDQESLNKTEPKGLTSLIISITNMVILIVGYIITYFLNNGNHGGTGLAFGLLLLLPFLLYLCVAYPICLIVSFISAIRALKYLNNTYAIVSIIISSLQFIIYIIGIVFFQF